jgi:hypothetical protein
MTGSAPGGFIDPPFQTRRGFVLLRLGLHRLPIREFPLLRSLAPALASYDGATELERGLDILLTGLTDSLTPRPAAQPDPGPPADDLHRER